MSLPFFNDKLPNSRLDLNNLLIKNNAATFFMRIEKDFEGENIKAGDILIVDKSLKPTRSSIVVGVLNGEFVILRVSSACKVETPFVVWGVVTYIIRKV